MKSETLIQFKSVSKKYSRSWKKSLVYAVKDLMGELFLCDKNRGELRPQEFWALRNVDFELNHGESIGIVGHNGAGKTTILKLINGLIKPNTGEICVNGRVGALIALGAGFNPLLTGRENIRVGGAMLGYSDEEIRRKEQMIIDFSEIGEFIDSPVQSYSSGMMARLGFSVAIHSEPEILLVDEVLAVGDLNFVIKCFRKILEFQQKGGAMILVSHNLYSIRANCSRALWIEHGELKMFGEVNQVCDAYEASVALKDMQGQNGEQYNHVGVKVTDVTYPTHFTSGQDFEVSFTFATEALVKKPILMAVVLTLTGVNVLTSVEEMQNLGPGKHRLKLRIPNLVLAGGTYTLNLVVASESINNQLYASTNQNRFAITGQSNKYAAGLLNIKSNWGHETL